MTSDCDVLYKELILVGYLTKLLVSKKSNVDHRMTKECRTFVEWKLARETEVFGENLRHCNFVLLNCCVTGLCPLFSVLKENKFSENRSASFLR
jgi:hypothetical protein